MTELEGHMQAEGTNRKALCGEPDAYIIDQGFTLDIDTDKPAYLWDISISCERCVDAILRRKGINPDIWREQH